MSKLKRKFYNLRLQLKNPHSKFNKMFKFITATEEEPPKKLWGRTRYELSIFVDGTANTQKFICISSYTPLRLQIERKKQGMLLERHVTEYGREIFVLKNQVEYIRPLPRESTPA